MKESLHILPRCWQGSQSEAICQVYAASTLRTLTKTPKQLSFAVMDAGLSTSPRVSRHLIYASREQTGPLLSGRVP